MKLLVIIGADGFGRVVLDILKAFNAADRQWEFLGFADDHKSDDPLIARRDARILRRPG